MEQKNNCDPACEQCINKTLLATNDNLLVMVPIIKETTVSGLVKGESVLKEEISSKRNTIYVVSVGPLVQDQSIAVGDQILVDGQLTMLPTGDGIPCCPFEGYEYAKVKAYHVFLVIKKDENN